MQKWCPAGVQAFSLKRKHHIYAAEVQDIFTGELTTGFLFGPWPRVSAREASPPAHLQLRRNAVYAAPIELCWQSPFTAVSTNIFRLHPAHLLPPALPPKLVFHLSLPQLSSILRNLPFLVPGEMSTPRFPWWGRDARAAPLAREGSHRGHQTQCPRLEHPPLLTPQTLSALSWQKHSLDPKVPVEKECALGWARHKASCSSRWEAERDFAVGCSTGHRWDCPHPAATQPQPP